MMHTADKKEICILIEQIDLLTASNKVLQGQLDESKRLSKDPLTGLPNRNFLESFLSRRIGEMPDRPFYLLLLNLGCFREVNDTLGFQYGDLLIKRVVARLQNFVSCEPETVARLDGNTFAIVLFEKNLLAATQEAQKILSVFTEPFLLDGIAVYVEGSIGISVYPDHGRQINTLIQHADVAVHLAKESINSYEVYSEEKDKNSVRHLALLSGLPRAMDENQLFLLYQPKLSMQTSRCVGVEALLRWNHPQYGLIMPNEFIRPTERTGLIKPLTEWVLQEAFNQYSIWNKNGDSIDIAVNLSARNVQDPRLIPYLATLFSKSGIDPHRLKLEITEGTIMVDSEWVTQFFTQLNKLGVCVSIDDFGTGYSSLSYLKKLPVNEIKIDQSFVMDMQNDESTAMIVHAIIELAHRLVTPVVAEGVENQETWDALKALGCDMAQGYFISYPLSAEAMSCWLERQNMLGTKLFPESLITMEGLR